MIEKNRVEVDDVEGEEGRVSQVRENTHTTSASRCCNMRYIGRRKRTQYNGQMGGFESADNLSARHGHQMVLIPMFD